jgi:glycine cleavage system transcriptional repressor
MILAISVTGQDRSGIIASITEAIFRAGGNLEDISMTILEGEFSMILLVKPGAKAALKKIKQHLEIVEKKFHLSISIKEIARELKRGEKHEKGTTPYMISVFGKDRAGIVYSVSKLLAEMRVNITDLNSKITGFGKKAVYALILEADVKKSLVWKLKKRLSKLRAKLKVEIAVNPIEPAQF